eukprot:765287-Hanusia_phi.AAC.3
MLLHSLLLFLTCSLLVLLVLLVLLLPFTLLYFSNPFSASSLSARSPLAPSPGRPDFLPLPPFSPIPSSIIFASNSPPARISLEEGFQASGPQKRHWRRRRSSDDDADGDDEDDDADDADHGDGDDDGDDDGDGGENDGDHDENEDDDDGEDGDDDDGDDGGGDDDDERRVTSANSVPGVKWSVLNFMNALNTAGGYEGRLSLRSLSRLWHVVFLNSRQESDNSEQTDTITDDMLGAVRKSDVCCGCDVLTVSAGLVLSRTPSSTGSASRRTAGRSASTAPRGLGPDRCTVGSDLSDCVRLLGEREPRGRRQEDVIRACLASLSDLLQHRARGKHGGQGTGTQLLFKAQLSPSREATAWHHDR